MLRLSENYYQKYFALLLVIEQENNDSAEITKRQCMQIFHETAKTKLRQTT